MTPLLLAILLAAPAAAELEKSCDAGEAKACAELGSDVRDGLGGVRRDLGRAATLFRKACKGKDPDGCADDARALALGEGQPANTKSALPRLEKMCKAGQARACGHLGDIFYRGRGRPQDGARAEELLDKSCKDGWARACTNLSMVSTREGRGERSEELAERGCDLGDPIGCSYLGDLYANSKDSVRATLFFARACEGGMPHGCAGQGFLLYQSGVDPQRGRDLVRKGCEAGDARACEVLPDMK